MWKKPEDLGEAVVRCGGVEGHQVGEPEFGLNGGKDRRLNRRGGEEELLARVDDAEPQVVRHAIEQKVTFAADQNGRDGSGRLVALQGSGLVQQLEDLRSAGVEPVADILDLDGREDRLSGAALRVEAFDPGPVAPRAA